MTLQESSSGDAGNTKPSSYESILSEARRHKLRRTSGPRQGKNTAAKKTKSPTGQTKPNLLVHDFFVVFRQLIPLLVAALAVFIVAMPVSTAAIPDISVFNIDYTHDQLKFRFFAEELGIFVVLACALFGAVCGMRAVRFLLVKKEATAVLSLPLSRTALFGTRLLACMLVILLGIGIPLTVSLLVNIAALNVWAGLFGQFAYVLAGLLLTACVACASSVVACALAGTLSEASAFVIALLASVSVATWGLGALCTELLIGNAAGETLLGGTSAVAPSLLESTSWANPLLFFSDEAALHQVFMVQHPIYEPLAGSGVLLAAWLGVFVLIALVALMLVKRRKGERAGMAGQSVFMTMLLALVVGLAAFGATFTLLASLSASAAVVAAFVVFVLLVIGLLRGPLHGRASWQHDAVVTGGGALVLAAVLACVATGAFGFSSYVPASADVAEVSVSYTGTPNYLAKGLDGATAYSGDYYFVCDYSFSDEQDIDLVREVHKRLAQTGGQPLSAGDVSDFSTTMLPYDIRVTYSLRNGKTVLRYYDRATLSELAALKQLDESRHIKELQRAVITGDVSLLEDDDITALARSGARQAYALGDIYLADRLYSAPMLLHCDDTARTELLAAIAEDVAHQSLQDRYYPQGSCRGVLMFTQAGEQAAETFAYGIENTVIYLTDEYTHTLEWIQKKNLSSYFSIDEPTVLESLTVQRYAPYEAMNAVSVPKSAYYLAYRADTAGSFTVMRDFGTNYSTKDPVEIAELLPLLQNSYYLDGGGYLVQAKLLGIEAYTYLFLPDAVAPEWLRRVAG